MTRSEAMAQIIDTVREIERREVTDRLDAMDDGPFWEWFWNYPLSRPSIRPQKTEEYTDGPAL